MSRSDRTTVEADLLRLPEPVIDEENPELTDADFARALPPESWPPEVFQAFPNTPRTPGRPRDPNRKRQVTLRLDPEVLDWWRRSGPGWQSRINEVLAVAAGLARGRRE